MKIFVLVCLVVVTKAAHLSSNYLPPSHAPSSGGSGSFLAAPFGGSSYHQPAAPSSHYGAPLHYQSAEAGAQIRSFENENNGQSYHYAYQTSNNINVQEHGQARVPGPEGNAIAAQGSFSYVSPEGQHISLEYTADENGFQPRGSHLPTPPPIPEAILRSLQYNAAQEQAGAYSSGAYHSSAPSNQYIPPTTQYLPPSQPSFSKSGYHY